METGSKLRAVLSVIDQSLHALKSQEIMSAASPGAATLLNVSRAPPLPSASAAGGQGSSSFHDGALNSITKTLLEAQVENTRLKDENGVRCQAAGCVLQRRIEKRRNGEGVQGGEGVCVVGAGTRYPVSCVRGDTSLASLRNV
jgi:hypothetical protein